MHVEPSVPEAGDDGSSEGMSQLRRRRVDLPQRSPVPPRSFPPRRAPGGTAVDITSSNSYRTVERHHSWNGQRN